MKMPNLTMPDSPNFSCGPTRKPDGWEVKKLNQQFLGRYHRSDDVIEYVEAVVSRIKKILNIPKGYELIITPGSTTGAMEAVIWSFLGENEITTIIYDYWADLWANDLKKLKLKVDLRLSLNGTMPSLKNIPRKNDILFVWTGTSTGMSVNNCDFIKNSQEGLVISDITSAVFIYDIPWRKLDISVFSWQKALGGESQHGMVVLSPKAKKRLKKKDSLPKVLDLARHNYLINTPSLLSFSDLEICLDTYQKRGSLKENNKICEENKKIIDTWLEHNIYLEKFSKDKNFDAITPSFLIPKKEINLEKVHNFLKINKIAFDIKNYKKAPKGIRIWTGPTIKKKDLIALTNWLDWSFKNINNIQL